MLTKQNRTKQKNKKQKGQETHTLNKVPIRNHVIQVKDQ